MRKNRGFLELRRLEAAREIANMLSASGNRVMLDSESLLLNGGSASSVTPRALVLMTLEISVAGHESLSKDKK